MEKEKVIIKLHGRSFYADTEEGTTYILISELNRCDHHKNINIHNEVASSLWGVTSEKPEYKQMGIRFPNCSKTSLRERAIETKKMILASLAEAQKMFKFSPHEF